MSDKNQFITIKFVDEPQYNYLATGNWKAIMECKKEAILTKCNCTYEPCSRKGICCDCIAYHLRSRELPACCFPAEAERTFDRSFEYFARMVADGRV